LVILSLTCGDHGELIEISSNVDSIFTFNILMGRLKPQSNGALYSNMVITRLVVDGWAVTVGTAKRGLGGLWPRPVPSLLYQM